MYMESVIMNNDKASLNLLSLAFGELAYHFE